MKTIIVVSAICTLLLGDYSSEKTSIHSSTIANNVINDPASEVTDDQYVVIVESSEIHPTPSESDLSATTILKHGDRVQVQIAEGKEDPEDASIIWLEVSSGDDSWIQADDIMPAKIFDALTVAEEHAKMGDADGMRQTLQNVQGGGIFRELSISPDGAKVIAEFSWFRDATWAGERQYQKRYLFVNRKGLAAEIKYKDWYECNWSADSRYCAGYNWMNIADVFNQVALFDTSSLKSIELGVCFKDMQAAFEFVDGYFLWVALVEPQLSEVTSYLGYAPTLKALNLSTLEKNDILVPDYSTVCKLDYAYQVTLVPWGAIPVVIKNSRLYKKYSESPGRFWDTEA